MASRRRGLWAWSLCCASRRRTRGDVWSTSPDLGNGADGYGPGRCNVNDLVGLPGDYI